MTDTIFFLVALGWEFERKFGSPVAKIAAARLVVVPDKMR